MKKVVRGHPSTVKNALVKINHFLARVIIWGCSTH